VKRTIYSGVKWGVDPLEDGCQINLFDEQTNEYVHIPFTGDSFPELMEHLIRHLTAEQRAALAPQMNGGIHIPGKDFDPTKFIQGPQG